MPDFDDRIDAFFEIEQEMKNVASTSNYGNDINEMYIGLICVPPKESLFYKPKRPKYTRGKEEYHLDGFLISSENSFEYEIVLNYEELKNAKTDGLKRLVISGILDSFDVFDKMKNKIPNFNKEKFKEDIKTCFIENGF